MIVLHRDQEGHPTQLTLTMFERNSREAYEELLSRGLKPQHQEILDILMRGRANANMLRALPQYNARIYELRRMGFCISSRKVNGERGRWFILSPNQHLYQESGECAVCGTPMPAEGERIG